METNSKPKAKVTGADSNVFVTLGICSGALRRAGMSDKATEMATKVFEAENYEQAISIMSEYCELH